jgi:hypothetical protein
MIKKSNILQIFITALLHQSLFNYLGLNPQIRHI